MKKRSEAMQTLRPQTNTQTDRQGRLQYTVQLSVQCKNLEKLLYSCRLYRKNKSGLLY